MNILSFFTLTKRCKLCNVPILFREYTWFRNGTFGKTDGLIYVILGVEELNNLFKKIGEKIGYPIDRLVFEAKANLTPYWLEYDFPPRMLKIFKFLSRFKFYGKLMEKVFVGLGVAGWGVPRKGSLEWRAREGVSMIVRRPFCIPIVGGGFAGTFQRQYEFPSTGAKWEEKEKGEVKFTVFPKDKESEIRKYIPVPTRTFELKLLPGKISYHPCPRCGIPKEFSGNFEWDIENGLIFYKKTKERMAMCTSYAVNTILGVLERELGKEIPKMVMEAEKEFIKKNFTPGDIKGTEEDYQKLLEPKDFGVKGWGNPVEVTKTGKTLQVRFDNPLYVPLIAGVIGGMYEAIEKTEANVQWTPIPSPQLMPTDAEGYTIIKINPKEKS